MKKEVRSLARSIARWTEEGEDPSTPVPGLSLYRYTRPSEPTTGFYEPSICLVVQGAKRVSLGDDTYLYDPEHYLLTSVHLPTVVQVVEASPEIPFLGLKLTFDLRQLSQLAADSQLPPPPSKQSTRGMATGRLTRPLLNAFRRMLDLLDEEQDIPILAPTIHREIAYRLLVGDQGARLRQIISLGGHSHRVAQAIDWLRRNYAQPLRVDDLAAEADMSSSSFYQHFRSLTAMSPLQYHKKLRLQEARRLMLTEDLDAATAAYTVGYESPSHFSREYSRLFGAPPARDITNLRQLASARS